jgi:tetratricopeptide (TPR) repeat protein
VKHTLGFGGRGERVAGQRDLISVLQQLFPKCRGIFFRRKCAWRDGPKAAEDREELMAEPHLCERRCRVVVSEASRNVPARCPEDCFRANSLDRGRMRRFFLAFFLVATALHADMPNEKAIARLYARGLAGDAQAVIDCVAALEAIVAARPNDQLARVYLGSAETLRSRDLPFGLKKWRTLRRGIALMDEAAAAVPDDARVQLLRAVTNEAFPAILGRRETARDALEKLVAVVEKNPAKLPPNDRQLLYLNAGEAAQRAGDRARARALWQKGMALEADPSLTKELRAAMAGGSR